MPFLTDTLSLVPPLAWQTAAAVVALIATVFALRGLSRATRAANRFFRHHIAPRPAEDVLTVIAASIATGVSAQGMWQFIDRTLHLHWALQAAGFAFIEVAVITSAVRAKRSMKEKYSAGIDGIAVWALTGLSAVLSAMEARSLPEAVFRLAAPLVAAWLWERGMAIERHRATGRKRINWRLTPERILVRLGLAEAQDRTANEVDAHRRLTRIAFAAKRARRLEAGSAAAWRQRRALRALDRVVEKAVEHANLAEDPDRQHSMLTRIRAVFAAEELRHVAPVAPWVALEPPAATATEQVAVEGGATEEVSLGGGATQKVADTATDTTPAPTPVAVTPAEPTDTDTDTDTDTRSGSATTDTDTTPVADRYRWRHRHPGPAETATDTSTPAATDTDTDTFSDTDTAPPVAPPPARHRHPAQNATTTDTDTRAATTPEPATPDTDTGDATLTATANATDTMRRHWDHAITHEGYLPDGAELARAGDCGDSYGRRMRSEWSEDLDPQLRERLLEEAKKRKREKKLHPRKAIALPTLTTPEPLIAHVNGHHTDGAA